MTERLFCKWTETRAVEWDDAGEATVFLNLERQGVIEGYVAVGHKVHAVVSIYPQILSVPLDQITLGPRLTAPPQSPIM